MKRFIILFIAIVCAVTFIAPVYADDKVSISGGFRVRAFDTENYWFGKTDESFFDQRLRIGTKINVADDVTVQLRADWGEGTWGKDYGTGLIVRPRTKLTKKVDQKTGVETYSLDASTSTLDIDRAFVDIKKEMWALRAGQQYMGLGVNKVLDANATGFKFDLNFKPVVTSLLYAKIDENGQLYDDNDVTANSEDEDFYAINVNYKCDVFEGNFFVGAKTDDTATEDSPLMVGIHGNAKLGMVNLTSELAIASGDTDDGKTDYMGTQFYLNANSDVADNVNIGAEILYALGTDDITVTVDDKGEKKYNYKERQFTTFANWSGFAPMDMNTPFAGDLDGGIPAKNYAGYDTFDPTGVSAGVQGVTLFVKYSPMDIVSVGAKFGYFQPEEDAITTVDDLTAFNVWATYTLATNTELAITYLYSDPEVVSGATDIDPEKMLITRLQITF